MKEANFVELPQDEYGNVSYTASQRRVIRARIESRDRLPDILHVIDPVGWAWPTVTGRIWKEVNHPPGPITMEKWRELTT